MEPTAVTPVRARVVRSLALGLILGALGVGVLLLGRRATSPPSPTWEAFHSPYKTEEEWLLREIVSDLANMAAFASTGNQGVRCNVRIQYGAQNLPLVRTECPGRTAITLELPLVHSTWAPEDYEAVGAALVATFGLKASITPDHDEDALLARLLDLRPDAIQAENARISQVLRAHPADPGSHEDAALLLGAFALRETTGSFSDARHILCRMTAHLGLARALRGSGERGRTGQWGEALLAAFAGRGAEAEARVQQLEAVAGRTQTDEAWCRVLRMRIGDDWRLLVDPAKRSLAERLEWLRAMELTLGAEVALRTVDRVGAESGDEVDQARILTRHPSVEAGNRFLEGGLAAAWNEVDASYSRIRGRTVSGNARISALNEAAQPFLSQDGPQVIAWGTWAAQYQRELLDLVERIESHYRYTLCIKDSAEAFAVHARPYFGGLTLFPIVDARWEAKRDKPSPRPLGLSLDVISQHPELINVGCFWSLEEQAVRQASMRRPPSRSSWFTTGAVRGTSFDVAARNPGLLMTADAIARMKAVSPKDYDVIFADLWHRGLTRPTVSQAQAAFGERLGYDLRAIRDIAEVAYEPDPKRYLALRRRMCEIDEAQCLILGADCVDNRDEVCAVAAYEKAVAQAPDRVRVSNSVFWLMSYYLRHGHPERARALAQMAADVGSAGGYYVMAGFLEQTGDYAAAEQWTRDERERYPQKGPNFGLIGFYYRMAHERRLAQYDAKFREASAAVFPRGLEKAELASLHAPPADGVRFATETPALRRSGLRIGDIVVAWDGWRVRDESQFEAVRAFSAEPDFRLIVWRDDTYLEVAPHRQGRRFYVQIASYKPPKSPPAGASTGQSSVPKD
jgi:hypothetical protein